MIIIIINSQSKDTFLRDKSCKDKSKDKKHF